MRRTTLSVLALAAGLMAPAAFADTPAAAPASTDPVVATVNGMQIHLSDIQKAAQDAPQQLQQLPPNQLFPLLLNQEIDRAALLVAAQQEDLEKQPTVAAAMAHAANVSLENAYVQQHVTSAVTDAAVQAEYDKNFAGKPGPEEVDARHILVRPRPKPRRSSTSSTMAPISPRWPPRTASIPAPRMAANSAGSPRTRWFRNSPMPPSP